MAREEANRRRGMINEISTSIDSTVTLIETISNKLELLRFDYRGLDDLKAELSHMRNLLGRAGFLRRSQSSVLFPFFERLRHFYFLLRKESEFEHVMVAEIAKFREIIRGFRLEFCEWNTSLLDVVLDKLPAGESWRELKLEVKLVKLFYHCAINGRDKKGNDFFLSDIKPGLDENAIQLYYYLVMLKPAYPGLAESLGETLFATWEYTQVCIRSSVLISSTYPWFCSELIGFLEYMLECFAGIIHSWEASDPRIKRSFGSLRQNLSFLKIFVHFSAFWVKNLQISQSFHVYCQCFAIRAVCFVCKLSLYSNDDCVLRDLKLKGSELVEKAKLGNDLTIQKYMEDLSRPSSFYMLDVLGMDDTADLVESLVDKLQEMLVARTSCMVSLDNTV